MAQSLVAIARERVHDAGVGKPEFCAASAANLSFITFARQSGRADGQIYVFFIMTLAAAEAAVGLAIIIALFRLRESTDVDELSLMKW